MEVEARLGKRRGIQELVGCIELELGQPREGRAERCSDLADRLLGAAQAQHGDAEATRGIARGCYDRADVRSAAAAGDLEGVEAGQAAEQSGAVGRLRREASNRKVADVMSSSDSCLAPTYASRKFLALSMSSTIHTRSSIVQRQASEDL